MAVCSRNCKSLLFVVMGLTMFAERTAFGQMPPVLNTVFPAGAQAGQSVEVTLGGSGLEGLRTLQSSIPGMSYERLDPNRVRLTFPENAPLGQHDMWAVSDNGISSPRTFVIGNRRELLETEPNDTASEPMPVPLDSVINGQLDKAGDADHFRFDAKQGQRVVIECLAERIDSRLRAVLEVFDLAGKRLAVNRGYFGIDPLIDFQVPIDGSYVVKIHDLTSSGSAEHYYRIDIDTGPRVAFSMPNVVERGKSSRVVLYGWNLAQTGGGSVPSSAPSDQFDRLEVDIPATVAEPSWPLPVRCQPSQATLEGFAWHVADSHAPVFIGVTDVPVVREQDGDHSLSSAQEIVVPCEVSGQLIAGDERDSFTISAERGEVFFIEAFGQRIQSPVDLQISVLDSTGQRELAQFSDEVRNIGGMFPTSHLDPTGRWVCPADGRYLIMIRNLTGGLQADLRRTYRLSVRREEPDFQVVVIPRPDDPAGLNVRRGGHAAIDLLAFRRRGCDGAICVSARDLPAGVECPDVWLGPGVERTALIVSADENASPLVGEIKLEAVVEDSARTTRAVRGGTTVRSGTPTGWGRITSQIPFAVSGQAPMRIIADGHETLDHHIYGKLEPKYSPGGILDVAAHIQRRDSNHQAPVKLIGVGLPDPIRNETTVIPAGQSKGYLSFCLPPTLPVGRYSLAIRAETTVPTPDSKTETVSVVSNPVTFEVHPAAMQVEIDPFAVTRARRGETITVGYSSKRLNGFIGKMHTELAAPGRITDVIGLRGRGETFTGQSEKGSLQILVNDDAPLGPQQYLRLFTVGVVEDEPTYFGSSIFPLEIVE